MCGLKMIFVFVETLMSVLTKMIVKELNGSQEFIVTQISIMKKIKSVNISLKGEM
jgi:hypothetical protein